MLDGRSYSMTDMVASIDAGIAAYPPNRRLRRLRAELVEAFRRGPQR